MHIRVDERVAALKVFLDNLLVCAGIASAYDQNAVGGVEPPVFVIPFRFEKGKALFFAILLLRFSCGGDKALHCLLRARLLLFVFLYLGVVAVGILLYGFADIQTEHGIVYEEIDRCRIGIDLFDCLCNRHIAALENLLNILPRPLF